MDFELEDGSYKESRTLSAHIKIAKSFDTNTGCYHYGMYMTKRALESLGDPGYVRFYISKTRKAIKVEPCEKLDKMARKVRHQKGISGAPNLIKKYGLPLGYYVMREPGVFYWDVSHD